MAIPYTFNRSSSGTLLISKTSDAGPNTQFILISTGGMGRSSIINRETSRMPAEHWESMEWYDGRDGEYYRIVFSVVQACANGTQEESSIAVTALETRHGQWGSEVNTPNPATTTTTTPSETTTTTTTTTTPETMSPTLTAARIHEVRLANDDLFWRQPHVHGVGEGFFADEDGAWTSEVGINVYVTESTDQSTLPEADRIPSTIEGIPVRIVVEPPGEYVMGRVGNDKHRPVVAGIRIFPARDNAAGIPTSMNPGTLTGLVTRNTDKKKFFVTNQHVLTGDARTSPDGNEELYQGDLDLEITFNPDLDEKIGGGDGLAEGMPVTAGGNNTADVAMCSHEAGVDASFALHGHGSNSRRQVIPGTIDPIFNPNPSNPNLMPLLMIGASGGEGTVHVVGVNQTRSLKSDAGVTTRFTGLTILNCENRPIKQGDSGAPCVTKIEENKYKMVCIIFGRGDSTGKIGYAFPASVAEQGLGIKFGNTPPVAVIRAPSRVAGQERRVELNGADSYDPDGDTITFLWEQENTGPEVDIVNPTSSKAYFDAPSFIPSRVIFKLTVKDSKGETGEARVAIDVGPVFPSSSATSGSDIDTTSGSDTDTTSGSDTDTTSGSDTDTTSGSDTDTTSGSDTDTTSGSDTETPATNRHPTADAGPNQTVNKGDVVTLDGSGSSDPDEDTLTYRWATLRDGPLQNPVTLSSSTSVNPTFTAPAGPVSLFFQLTVSDGRGGSDTATVAVTVRAEVWGDWTDTGNTRGSAASREKEQSRSSTYGNTETQWVSDPGPEVWPETWTNTQETRGSGLLRERKQTRTSNYSNTQTQWVSDPEEIWNSLWRDTGRTRGSLGSRKKQQSRTSNLGNTAYRWVSYPEPEVYPPTWRDTGRTRGSLADREKEQSRTSNYSNTRTRWVSYPEPEIYPETWTDTLETRESGLLRERKQTRTSNYGNTQTQWVSDPEEIWNSLWRDTGRTRGSSRSREKEQSRTSNLGNTAYRWVSDPEPTPTPTPTPTPEPETWGSWTDTGNTMSIGGGHWVKEQRRTSSRGNTETRWVSL